MGADVHLFVERMLKGRWVPVDPPGLGRTAPKDYSDPEFWKAWDRGMEYVPAPSETMLLANEGKIFEDIVPEQACWWSYNRDYDSFGWFAGVRGGDAFIEPRGLPEDIAEETLITYCIRVLPDEHPDVLQGAEGVVAASTAARWTDKNYGCEYREIGGQTYIEDPDWHTPTYYTLAELDKHMNGCIEELPGRMKELRKELKKVAKKYKLSASEVRIVLWFDN